jgi:hypothetical protein
MPSMIRYRWGDTVLVAFPLSDMSGAVRRPVMVLLDSGDEDVMLARITTQGCATGWMCSWWIGKLPG